MHARAILTPTLRRGRPPAAWLLGGFVVLAACTTLATSASAQGALAKAKAGKVLVVGISGGNAPIAWMSPNDEPLGITLDLCKELIKREGIEKLDVYTMPFASLIPALTSGRIDLACDTFFPTEKRKLLVDFTDIVFYNSETLIVKQGNPKKIHKLADLDGKSGGSYEGTVWMDWLNDLNKRGAKINVKAYPTPTELIADVAAGRLDGGIIDAVLAAYAVKQNPKLGIEVVADYQPREKQANAVALAVRKDSADLREAFNRTLAAMKGDGSVDKVFERYGLVPPSFYLKP
ncbi:MAG: amino acid ABC transporter substrate-binding protein [Candidatus Rokubacteria bacterium]|nr:amino acid ABC transporter substrate-binding protein [Candidatus Rokubacteria bacterium]